MLSVKERSSEECQEAARAPSTLTQFAFGPVRATLMSHSALPVFSKVT